MNMIILKIIQYIGLLRSACKGVLTKWTIIIGWLRDFVVRFVKIQCKYVIGFIKGMIPQNKWYLTCAAITFITGFLRIFVSPIVLLQSPIRSNRKETCETRSVRQSSLRDALEQLIGGHYSLSICILSIFTGFNDHYMNVILSRLNTWRRYKAKKKLLNAKRRYNDVYVDPYTCDRMRIMTEVLRDKSLYEEIFQKLKFSIHDDNLMRNHYQSLIPLNNTNSLAVVDWIGYAELHAIYVEVFDERSESSYESTVLEKVIEIIDDFKNLVITLFNPNTYDIEIDISNTRKPYRPIRGGEPWHSSKSINVCVGMGPQRKDYTSNMLDLIVDGILLRQQTICLVRSKMYLPYRSSDPNITSDEVSEILQTVRAMVPIQLPIVATGFSFGATLLLKYLHKVQGRRSTKVVYQKKSDIMTSTSMMNFDSIGTGVSSWLHVNEGRNSSRTRTRNKKILLYEYSSETQNTGPQRFLPLLGSGYYNSCESCIYILWKKHVKACLEDIGERYLSVKLTTIVDEGDVLNAVGMISPIISDDFFDSLKNDLPFRSAGYWETKLLKKWTGNADKWANELKLINERNTEILTNCPSSEKSIPENTSSISKPSQFSAKLLSIHEGMKLNSEGHSRWDLSNSSGGLQDSNTTTINDDNDDDDNHCCRYQCRLCSKDWLLDCNIENTEECNVYDFVKRISDPIKFSAESLSVQYCQTPVILIVAENDFICTPCTIPLAQLIETGPVTVAISPWGGHCKFSRSVLYSRTWSAPVINTYLSSSIDH